MPNGKLAVDAITLDYTSTDRSNAQNDKILLGNGVIVAACADIVGGTLPPQPGMTFIGFFLMNPGKTSMKHQLIGDYWHIGHIPVFPGRVIGLTEGPGRLYTAGGVDPAAGAEVADTVPTNARWRLRAVEVVLVTDGTVANRNTNLFVDDASATITRYLMLTDGTNQTATQTRTHSWTPGTDNDSTNSVSVTDGGITLLAKYPMSLQNGVFLNAGANIRTVTTGIVAGDNYGAARYIVEEWISGG